MKRQSPLALKRAEKERQDAKLRAALDRAKRKEKQAYTGQIKRKTNAHLSRYLELSLESRDAIRPESEFAARSYNLSRQVLTLIDHLYVRYPVPRFLYRTMLSKAGVELVFGTETGFRGDGGATDYTFRPWFLAVARGNSLAKLTKDTLTKREAHWFLRAPDHFRVRQNIFWAQAAAAGVPRAGCDYLVRRFDAQVLKRIGTRMPDFLRFFAEYWADMDGDDRDWISDYLRAAVENPDFSFKGRTLGSVKKLSREWHRTLYIGRVAKYVSWPPSIPRWEHKSGGQVVRAFELANNRALAEEGQHQRHCVFTYTEACRIRSSRIISMRWYSEATQEETSNPKHGRLTMEVWPSLREVAQIRGKLNRMPTPEELKVVRHWAGELGLKVSEYAVY